MTATISAASLRELMRSDDAYALIDVRELGEIEAGHILGVTFLPRRMIEFRIADLVPLRSTRIVVCDEGGARAGLAAETLRELGYSDVVVLDGGTAAWKASGGELIDGNNVPSKLFGERVHDTDHTPSVKAVTLQEWGQQKKPFLVCDIRTPEEYARSRIPGAFSTPGFDVGLCMPELKDRGVPIVVNCAGRTRSIIACETLRQLGMKEVFALENGTMGWVLAGLSLEKGEGAGVIAGTPTDRADAHGRAEDLAQSVGVVRVTAQQVRNWLEQRDRGEANVYAFDARQTNEYDAGHIEGTAILPGALAIQRTDEYMPVRQAQVVFIDDDETRALLAAYWLRRMNFPRVAVLSGGVQAWVKAGFSLTRGRSRRPPLGLQAVREQTRGISADALRVMLSRPHCTVINVDTSTHFAQKHITGSVWVPRGWLEARIASVAANRNAPIVVTCRDGQQSTFAAATLARLGYSNTCVLAGGLGAAGELPVEQGPAPAAEEIKDVILPPYAKGTAAMQRYLEWETKLTRVQSG
jgi:rhodanese-related sulfurtransferase